MKEFAESLKKAMILFGATEGEIVAVFQDGEYSPSTRQALSAIGVVNEQQQDMMVYVTAVLIRGGYVITAPEPGRVSE